MFLELCHENEKMTQVKNPFKISLELEVFVGKKRDMVLSGVRKGNLES